MDKASIYGRGLRGDFEIPRVGEGVAVVRIGTFSWSFTGSKWTDKTKRKTVIC